MFDYETGIGIAFLLWFASAVVLIVSINSRMNRNLEKIGQRLSWLSLTPKPMSASDQNRSPVTSILKFLLVIGLSLPFVLLSWMYVAIQASTFVYKKAKDAGAPQVIREFRWKLKNVDMTFDQVVKEGMKISEQPLEEFEKARVEILDQMSQRGLRGG